MNSIERIKVDRLAGEILRLDREVEGLVTAGRQFFGQQIRMVGYIHEDNIKPQIVDTEEAYEMERMLRAMNTFCGLDEAKWRRTYKSRKQAIDIMRVTTEVVVRRLIKEVLEHGNS